MTNQSAEYILRYSVYDNALASFLMGGGLKKLLEN